jgi:hypothetical protein
MVRSGRYARIWKGVVIDDFKVPFRNIPEEYERTSLRRTGRPAVIRTGYLQKEN